MRVIIILWGLFLCQITFAQEIKIKEVKESVSGTDAFHAPIDSNGNPCGLVKVLSTFEDLSFDGSIVGDIENKTNEYHVFLSKGSKELIIKRPHVLPVKVRFEDYGIEEISSKATYNITLRSSSLNANKNSVTFDVRPKGTNVSIDGILIDNENGDGFYQLLLPKGEHIIKFEAKGYRSSVQIVKSGKEAINLNIELESLLATLDIRCQTSTAEIWIGDDMKGTGAWQGKLPAGKYIVTAKQKGFNPQTKEVTLEEKSSRSFVLPMLERAMGKLLIKTDPTGATVTIDGQSGYKSDASIDVKVGQHTIIASLPFGYKEEKREIEVNDEMNTINIKLNPLNSTYAAAFDGDIDKQIQIKEALNFYEDSTQYVYWRNRIYNKMLNMDDNSFLLYYEKMDCTTYDLNLECLLRKAKLDRGWSYPAEKSLVYSNIVKCYESLGNYQEAIKWGDKLCKMDPQYINYKQLAQLYEKIGNKVNAIASYKKAAGGVWDVKSWASVDLADAYYRLGYKSEAAKCYKDLLNNWAESIYKDMKNEWRKKLKEMGY